MDPLQYCHRSSFEDPWHPHTLYSFFLSFFLFLSFFNQVNGETRGQESEWDLADRPSPGALQVALHHIRGSEEREDSGAADPPHLHSIWNMLTFPNVNAPQHGTWYPFMWVKDPARSMSVSIHMFGFLCLSYVGTFWRRTAPYVYLARGLCSSWNVVGL